MTTGPQDPKFSKHYNTKNRTVQICKF